MQLSQTAQDEAEGLPTYFDGAFRGGGMKIDAKDAIAKMHFPKTVCTLPDHYLVFGKFSLGFFS